MAAIEKKIDEMTISHSLFSETQVGCGKCHKPFSFKTPLVINVTADPQYTEQLKDMSLFVATCDHCGYKAKIPSIFLYYDPTRSILWVITTEDYVVRYQQLRNFVTKISSDYIKTLPSEEVDKFRSISWQLIPLGAFLQKISSPLAKGVGLGYIHFYPSPKVSADSRMAQDFEPSTAIQIQNFDVGLAEGNYPDFYNTLWDLLHTEFQYNRQYVRTERIVEPKKPIGTYGFPELLIYVGSNIVLPLFISALANLITYLILEKRKAKQQLEETLEKSRQADDPRYIILEKRAKKIIEAQNNEILPSDKIQVRLRVLGDKKEYIFRGNIREVCKQMKTFRRDILRSVRIPDDCHIALFVGDHYVDAHLENRIGKSSELKKSYGKIFSKSTRVRFAEGEQGEYVMNSITVCKQAKDLMFKEHYEEAALLLQDQLRGEETSIEVLYNYALCLDALGHEDEADFFYEQVLIRAINLPSLEDTAQVISGLPLGDD